jgi:DNA-binding Lrp family transcriptional regulator
MAVSRKALMADMEKNPGQSTRQLADKFGLFYDHLWDRMRHMEEEGYIIRSERESEKKTGGLRYTVVWTVNPVAPVRLRHDWSDDDEATLRRIYPTAMPHELRAEFPTRSLLAIRKKAEGMKLKRDASVVSKARALTSRLAVIKRHNEIHDAEQMVRIVQAPSRDESIVVKALQRRIALEMAWGGCA